MLAQNVSTNADKKQNMYQSKGKILVSILNEIKV